MAAPRILCGSLQQDFCQAGTQGRWLELKKAPLGCELVFMEVETLRSGLALVWELGKRGGIGARGGQGDRGGDEGGQEKRFVIITGFRIN